MDIVFEVIGELVSALAEWFLESEKVPNGIRIALICLLYSAVIGLCLLILILSESIGIKIFMLILTALLLYGGIKAVRKVLKR